MTPDTPTTATAAKCDHKVRYVDPVAYVVREYTASEADCPHCLRSALAAAREQHKALLAKLAEVQKHDAEAYRYFMANDNVGGIFSYGLLHSALAALAPSQPTPNNDTTIMVR